MKVLALSFLILIGVLLTAESLDQHVNKGYIYFAMAFALGVELVNIRVRKKQDRRVDAASPAHAGSGPGATPGPKPGDLGPSSRE